MAITSSTDIGNMALDLLSADTVNDIDNPESATEELLARWYPQARKKVLREHPWNCASKRIVLAASATSPAFGYESAFPLPNDFIRLKYITDDEGNIIPASKYTVENGNVLYEGSGLYLVYVYDMTDVASMDVMLVDLIAIELAMMIANKITDSGTETSKLADLQKQRTALAKAIDGQENPPFRIQYSRALNSRRNRTDYRTDRVIW